MITTAEELIWKEDFISDGWTSSWEFETVKKLMIEFAKLHVQEALKNANEKVEIHSDSGSNYHREFEEGIRNNTIWVPANSILNAYPLENIK
jgi:hypothetical protein